MPAAASPWPMLDLTEPTRTGPSRPACSKARARARSSDRVAQLGAGAVRLHVADGPRVGSRAAQGRLDQRGLGARVGNGVTARAAAVVEAGGADDGEHGVAVGACPVQPLEDDRARPLAGHEAVAAGAERPGAVAARGHAERAQSGEAVRVEVEVDAAGQGQVGLVLEERPAGQVQGGQRRGAHRVDGEAGPAEVEGVRDPVGHRGGGRDGVLRVVGAGRACVTLGEQMAVGRDPGEHADPRASVTARQGVTGVSGRLEGLACHLQEQALLRVHERGVARPDPEHRRLEGVDAVEEAAVAGVSAAAGARGAPVPAFGGHLAHGGVPGDEQVPEGVDVRGAGVAAGQPDDGDGSGVLARSGHGTPAPGRRGGRRGLGRVRNGGPGGGGSGGRGGEGPGFLLRTRQGAGGRARARGGAGPGRRSCGREPAQVPGERTGGGVLEGQCGGHVRGGEQRAQPLAELLVQQGVHAQFGEGGVGVDQGRVPRGEFGDECREPPYEVLAVGVPRPCGVRSGRGGPGRERAGEVVHRAVLEEGGRLHRTVAAAQFLDELHVQQRVDAQFLPRHPAGHLCGGIAEQFPYEGAQFLGHGKDGRRVAAGRRARGLHGGRGGAGAGVVRG
ncbi:hypothetical protein RKD39_000041 [Streptomyces albogriseolus]